MAWVKAEYAPELAVLSAWVGALLPWSFTLQSDGPLGSILLFVRWPLGELQVRLAPTVRIGNETIRVERVLDAAYGGSQLWGPFHAADPLSATSGYSSGWVTVSGYAWLVGTAAITGAVVLSIAIYTDQFGTNERLPIDPVHAMAGLLGLATVGFGLATVGLWFGPPRLGIAIPIGVLILAALAISLARVDRV